MVFPGRRGFLREELSHSLVGDDLRETFPRFFRDLFEREIPQLHVFETGGRDGGIDFFAPLDSGRLVGDCKHLSSDGLKPVESAWREVAGHLEKHLASPDGPTKGQAQYGPWYDTVRPIKQYDFVISSTIKNLEQWSKIHTEIREFFQTLAARPHLSHLARLEVRVLDWTDIEARLRAHPSILMRWFPRSRLRGLAPFGGEMSSASFGDYLAGNRLRFYSRAEHGRRSGGVIPAGSHDERALLGLIDHERVTGLIITGAGGVGKTRLAFELGHIAMREGWTVLRAGNRVDVQQLDQLAGMVTRENRVLVLIDYAETQADFVALLEQLNELNDRLEIRLAYIATCRSSYYGVIEPFTRKVAVDLSPPSGSVSVDWERDYRTAVVTHILEGCGLAESPSALQICRDSPVLAVFMLYLHERGRDPDLKQLLKEEDFGEWVGKRIQSTFQDRLVSRELATIVALLPFGDDLAGKLGSAERQILDRLAVDGWVYRQQSLDSTPPMWAAAHDVLADKVMLAYLRSIPATTQLFMRDLLVRAERYESAGPALVALQRIKEQSLVSAVDWHGLLLEAIVRAPAAWRALRTALFTTPLLSVVQQLNLLVSQPEFFDGAEQSVDFQNRLGWFARMIVRDEPGDEVRAHSASLGVWVARAAPHVDRSNFVLTWGLRLDPERVQPHALEWLAHAGGSFQAHFLLASWLQAGLNPDAIQRFVKGWLLKHTSAFNASFLHRAWLDARGELATVRDAIRTWLITHRLDQSAQFVYRSWLAAGGEIELVRDDLLAWVSKHGTTESAHFVLSAWLVRTKDLSVVEPAVRAWLAANGPSPGAGLLFQAWITVTGELASVADELKSWIVTHQRLLGAGYCFTAWLEAGGDPSAVERELAVWLSVHGETAGARMVLVAWLKAGGDLALKRGAVARWLSKNDTAHSADYVFTAWLDAGGERSLIWDHVLSWLKVHGERDDVDFLCSAWLESGGAFEVVKASVLKWVHAHRESLEDTFLLKYVARLPTLPDFSIEDVLLWCERNPGNKEAIWKLTQLHSNVLRPRVRGAFLRAAEAVVGAWLARAELSVIEKKQGIIIAANAALAGLASPKLRPVAERVLAVWLRDPRVLASPLEWWPNSERPELVACIAAMVESSALDPLADVAALLRFVDWVRHWQPAWLRASRLDLEALEALLRP